ncbi:putative ankyrin repeat protein RF_0381 [Microplitis mediator]|uniref:putative ankyrin repeat protein RF_0381 n=1 Tax=Microplitis mediator TaxID=375433 RepID=UPI002553962A|nr:putative ankyrin repeat protein RF_0381 [Microplitis mediator]
MEIIANVEFENINLTFVKDLFNQSPHLGVNTVFWNPMSMRKNSPSTLLLIALRNKDEELFNYLIAQKADVTINCHHGTPLHEAVRQNNFDVIKKLIALGAGVNVCADGTGETPLFCAVRQNDYEMSKYLIELGADVNLKCSKPNYMVGETPLHAAAHLGYESIVELLLNNNAVVDARAEDGNTPLLAAAFRGHTNVMKLLLEHGADLNSRTKRSHRMVSVLHDVLFATKSEVLEFLFNLDNDATDVNTLTRKNMSLLHCFLKYFGGVGWVIHTLLNAGVDVNTLDCDDKLAIDYKKIGYDAQGNPQVHPDIVIVQQHIVKLMLAGLPVCERNAQSVEGEKFDKCRLDCKKELEVMRKTNVGAKQNITYYDVLTKADDELCTNLKYPEFEKSAERVKLREMFPLYGEMIWFKLYRIMRKIHSMEITSLERPISKL